MGIPSWSNSKFMEDAEALAIEDKKMMGTNNWTLVCINPGDVCEWRESKQTTLLIRKSECLTHPESRGTSEKGIRLKGPPYCPLSLCLRLEATSSLLQSPSHV